MQISVGLKKKGKARENPKPHFIKKENIYLFSVI